MIHRFFSKSALPPLSQQLAQTPISKFMTRNPYSVMKTTPVGIAIQTMLTHGISGLPVVDVSQVCIGLYTELDAMIQAASQPLDAPIRFRSPAISVQSDFTFKEVLGFRSSTTASASSASSRDGTCSKPSWTTFSVEPFAPDPRARLAAKGRGF